MQRVNSTRDASLMLARISSFSLRLCPLRAAVMETHAHRVVANVSSAAAQGAKHISRRPSVSVHAGNKIGVITPYKFLAVLLILASPQQTAKKVTAMKKESRSQQAKKAAGAKKPSSAREYPGARDSRGSPGREEIRSKTPMVSAPRQSQRPVERSSQKRAHTRNG